MTDLQKVAVGKIVLRAKEHLVAIRPLDGALCIETMRYADEVIPIESIEEIPRGDDIAPSQKELDMARQLIEALSGDFEPEKYTDAYREQLLEIIEKKAAGEEIVAEPLVEEPAKVRRPHGRARGEPGARGQGRERGPGPGAGEGGGEEDQEGRRQEGHEGDEDPLALAQVGVARLRSQPLRQRVRVGAEAR